MKGEQEMEIIQVIGYKNSGKTTTAIALINYLSKQGITVASLKHHGHGGIPLSLDSKDSSKHHQAGARLSGVEGAGLFQLMKQEPWELEQLIAIYKLMGVEVLIIEGFKKEDFKKIVMINKEEELALLEQTTNIIAAVTNLPLKATTYPIFKTSELTQLCEWIYANYRQGNN